MIGAGSHLEDELAHRWKTESTAKSMAMTKKALAVAEPFIK
jgi:hypothetical protein